MEVAELMTESLEIIVLLVGVAIFAVAVPRAVSVTQSPSLGDWVSGLYVLVVLVAPFIAKAVAPTVRSSSWREFAIFSAIFYVLVGAAVGYETGLAQGERRSRR